MAFLTNKAAALRKLRLDWIALFLVILGAALRLRQYLFNRSFWFDEAMLANNIVQHSIRFLLTQPLDSDQVAPIGLLLSLKLIGRLFGYRDLYLRLAPLLFGLALLLVALGLMKRFKHPMAQYLFVALLAISPVLIYYSSELKPYIVEVFVAAFLLWVGLRNHSWRHGYLILLACGGFAILCSSSAVFVLAAVGIPAAVRAGAHRDWSGLLRLTGVGFFWVALFLLSYFLTVRYNVSNSFLVAYWKGAFAPLPNSLLNLRWYLDSLLGLSFLGFSPPGPASPVPLPAWSGPVNMIVCAGMLAGIYALYRRDREWFIINLLVILFVLAASTLKLYPFRSRPILFLIPILFSFLCAFVDWLVCTPVRFTFYAGVGLAAFYLALLAIPGFNLFSHPINQEDIKGALRYIYTHQRSGDKIALGEKSTAAYSFYEHSFQMDEFNQLKPIPVENDADKFLNVLCARWQFGRIWILFSHRFGEHWNFLARLSAVAPLLDHWEGDGSGVYLFDFSPAQFCHSID